MSTRIRPPFMDKPDEGWLHDNNALGLGNGISYSFPVTYLGSVVISASLRSLGPEEQQYVCRDLIARLAVECGLREDLQQFQPPHLERYINGTLTKADVPTNLNISSQAFVVVLCEVNPETGAEIPAGILETSKMGYISLAAGGEAEDYELVCYVAKNEAGHRECHVFDCGQLSDEVLQTMGQAFTLAKNAKKSGSYVKAYPSREASTTSSGYAKFESMRRKKIDQESPYDIATTVSDVVDEPLYDFAATGYFDPRSFPSAQDGLYFEVDGSQVPAAKEGEDQYFDPKPAAATDASYFDPSAEGGATDASYFDPSAEGGATDASYFDPSSEDPKAYFDPSEKGFHNPSFGSPAQTESLYDNPMAVLGLAEDEPLYDNPHTAVSQYQHVDMLPEVTPEALMTADPRDAVMALNAYDSVRRAVRTKGKQGEKDAVAELSEKPLRRVTTRKHARPSWVYMSEDTTLPNVDVKSLAAGFK
eukprot:m.355225 g.355225  ORF g.355225 m.355225 type:complete len:476 (-) comp17199_c0_seq1:289-1716(-)